MSISVTGRNRLLFVDMIRLSLRAFRRRSLRNFLTTFGISVGIGVVLFVVSLGFGFRKILIEQMVKTSDSLFSIEAFIPNDSGFTMTNKDLREMRAIHGVAEISPISDFSGELSYNQMNGVVAVRVIEPSYFRLAGKIPSAGREFRAKESGLVVSSAALQLFNLHPYEIALGRPFDLVIHNGDTAIQKKAVSLRGVIEDNDSEPYVLAPRSLFGSSIPSEYQSVLVRANTLDLVLPIRDVLLNRGIYITAKLDLIMQATKVLNVATFILTLFGVTTLAVSAIGMFNTMTITLLERTYEIGIMKSLGARDRDIRRLFLSEALCIGFFGGIIGLLIGVTAADLINYGVNALAHSFKGNSIDLFMRPAWFMITLIGFSSLISLFTGYWPARRSMKLSPIAAFQK